MTKPRIIDLDAKLPAAEPVPTQPVRLFGREWMVKLDLNSFTITSILAGEAAGYVAFLKNIVVPEQQREFADALAGAENLTAERLLAIVSSILEVAGGGDDDARPTMPSSDSSHGEPTRPTARKSAVRSSARTGGPSTRRR